MLDVKFIVQVDNEDVAMAKHDGNEADDDEVPACVIAVPVMVDVAVNSDDAVDAEVVVLESVDAAVAVIDE